MKTKENKKKQKKISKKYILILTVLINIITKIDKVVLEIFFPKPLGPYLFFSRDQFTCSHIYFWGSICECN